MINKILKNLFCQGAAGTKIARNTSTGIKVPPSLIFYQHNYNNLFDSAKILDYGAGTCIGTQVVSQMPGNVLYETFEPFPTDNPNEQPTYTSTTNIPTGNYDVVLCDYVMNVLPHAQRKEALQNILKSLSPNGRILLSVRADKKAIKNLFHNGWFPFEDGFARKHSDGSIRFQGLFCGANWLERIKLDKRFPTLQNLAYKEVKRSSSFRIYEIARSEEVLNSLTKEQ